MDMVGACIQNAEKETSLCCIKMEPFKPQWGYLEKPGEEQ